MYFNEFIGFVTQIFYHSFNHFLLLRNILLEYANFIRNGNYQAFENMLFTKALFIDHRPSWDHFVPKILIIYENIALNDLSVKDY